MARKVAAVLGESVRGKIIAVLGLTFKPDTDDMREAPSIALITALQDLGATVRAFDPAGMEQAKKVLCDVTYTDGPYECAEGAEALVIVTEWEQFRALDFKLLKQIMARAVVVDLRNIYRSDEMARHGFTYASVGGGICLPEKLERPPVVVPASLMSERAPLRFAPDDRTRSSI
jgi:UDPglucose 6-dehydrogenase